jgi:hypothetical protein
MLKNIGRGDMAKAALILALVLAGCSQQVELRPIQQQRSGDYLVTLLNDTGVLKQNADHLTLEFRNPSTNELVSINNLKVQASMLMPGMGPMFGTLSTPEERAPGRYEFDADVGMAGQWTMTVTFDPNRRVQFALRAQ